MRDFFSALVTTENVPSQVVGGCNGGCSGESSDRGIRILLQLTFLSFFFCGFFSFFLFFASKGPAVREIYDQSTQHSCLWQGGIWRSREGKFEIVKLSTDAGGEGMGEEQDAGATTKQNRASVEDEPFRTF